MKTNSTSYRGYRFPREVISHGVWLYYRFSLSFRDVEELLAEWGITVTHETGVPPFAIPPTASDSPTLRSGGEGPGA